MTFARLHLLLAAAVLGWVSQAQAQAQAQAPLAPSPEWARAMPAGPAAGTRLTTEYVKEVGRTAYFWAWPMMNLENRLVTFRPVKQFALSGGVLPIGPVNEVA